MFVYFFFSVFFYYISIFFCIKKNKNKCGERDFFFFFFLLLCPLAGDGTMSSSSCIGHIESVYTTLWWNQWGCLFCCIFIYYKREKFLWKDKNSVAMKMDGWILHKIAFTGWEDGYVLTHWVEQKKKFFFLSFFLLFL